jgi:carbon-monoxide dehydrogenase large subunit
MGQGIATSYTQLVVDVFGVEIERIRIVMGDTDRGTGFGSAGSRSLFTAGSAINHASELAVANGKDMAAEALEASAADIVYGEGMFRIAGTDRGIGLFDLAAQQPDRRIYVDATSSVGGPSWPNGAHIAEVEVDPDTGTVEIVSYTTVNDFGVLVNPMLVAGQAHGGIAQGVGQALMESVVYDEDGQMLTGSYMDYGLPRASDLPGLGFESHPVPARTNPLGAKGCGEAGCAGSLPAVMNALVDALSEFGIRHIDMPATPLRIWQAIQEARGT